ncbi:MAG: hypothetical protein ACFCUI_09810 [Bernardetiaceae bacterium]
MKSLTFYRRSLPSLVLCLWAVAVLHAQELPTFDLPAINADRLALNQKAMLVLGTWGLGNMALGAWQMGRTQGQTRYFHQMNLFWNVVNVGLAASGYWASPETAGWNIWQTANAYHQLEKILLLNAGLDVGYVMTGFFLRERGQRRDSQRLQGYGYSLLMQGGWLFVFDLGFYALVHGQYLRHLGPLELTTTLGGLGLVYRF